MRLAILAIVTFMVGAAIALVVAIFVSPGKDRRLAAWMQICMAHDFSARQCELLFVLKEGAEDDAALAASLAAAGIAAGAAQRH